MVDIEIGGVTYVLLVSPANGEPPVATVYQRYSPGDPPVAASVRLAEGAQPVAPVTVGDVGKASTVAVTAVRTLSQVPLFKAT